MHQGEILKAEDQSFEADSISAKGWTHADHLGIHFHFPSVHARLSQLSL